MNDLWIQLTFGFTEELKVAIAAAMFTALFVAGFSLMFRLIARMG